MFWKKNKSITSYIIFLLYFFGGAQNDSTIYSPNGKGWMKINKSNAFIKIGGYVKADLIYDLNPINQTDFFDVSNIPTNNASGTNVNLNAKETRLLIDSRISTKLGVLKTYIESDFYGNNGALRLRIAYIDIGDKFRVGQYWSNFMDEDIIPNTLDFEKPSAYLFARNVTFRYKIKTGNNSYLAFAIESPTNRVEGIPSTSNILNVAPDLNARYRYYNDNFHIQLSGYGAFISIKDSLGKTSNLPLYGASISGKFNLFKSDHILFQGLYGAGIGRYRGGYSAVLTSNNELKALVDYGITVGYKRQWLPKWYSILVFNYGEISNSQYQYQNAIKALSYFAVDLCYSFLDNAYVGLEYLHGMRLDVNKAEGRANRLQFSVKYQFN